MQAVTAKRLVHGVPSNMKVVVVLHGLPSNMEIVVTLHCFANST